LLLSGELENSAGRIFYAGVLISGIKQQYFSRFPRKKLILFIIYEFV